MFFIYEEPTCSCSSESTVIYTDGVDPSTNDRTQRLSDRVCCAEARRELKLAPVIWHVHSLQESLEEGLQ